MANFFVGYELMTDDVGVSLASGEISKSLSDPIKVAKAKDELNEKMAKMPITGRIKSVCVLDGDGNILVDETDPNKASGALLSCLEGKATDDFDRVFGFGIRDALRTAYLFHLRTLPRNIAYLSAWLLMPNLPVKFDDEMVVFVDPYADALKADVQKQISLDALCVYLNVDVAVDMPTHVAQATRVGLLAKAMGLTT